VTKSNIVTRLSIAGSDDSVPAMSTIDPALPAAGQRGPVEHDVRSQIVDAAEAHFSRYGYGKTTVADLAKAIGFSKAYIYKFFDSKQAIGQAICVQCLDKVLAAGEAGMADGKTATEKLRRFFNGIVTTSAELFFEDKLLYDIAAYSAEERWPSALAYVERAEALLREIILSVARPASSNARRRSTRSARRSCWSCRAS
jgi:AcrR family transcriptional regulator